MSEPLKQQVEVNATEALSELDRYNAKLKEMADRQSQAADSAAKLTQASEDQFKAAARLADVAERKAQAEAEVSSANEELARTARTVTAEEVNQLEKTGRLTAGKKQLKEAIKGLSSSFPELGRIAQFALNPITFAFTALTAAVVLWRDRLSDSSRDFEKHKGFDPTYINTSAAAYLTLAENVSKVKTAASGVSQELDKILEKYKLIEQLGGKSPQSDEQSMRDQAAAKFGAAANARIAAQNLRRQAAAIKVGSGAGDASTLAKVQADAAKASAANDEIAKQLELVDAAEQINEGSSDLGIVDQTQVALQYGWKFKGSSPADIRATLLQQQASNQQIIDRGTSVKQRLETGAAKRTAKTALEKAAAEKEAEAAQLAQEAGGLRTGAETSQGARLFGADVGRPSVFVATGPGRGFVQTDTGRRVGITPTGEGNSITPEAYRKLRSAAQAMIEFANQAERESQAKPATGANVSSTQGAL